MGEMTQSVKAARRLWGSIEAGPEFVTIAGLGSATEIPYDRISSLRSSWWHATLDIETGAEVHHVAVWNPWKIAALKAEINDRIYSLTRPRPIARSIRAVEFANGGTLTYEEASAADQMGGPPVGRVNVDDGGPGEEGTFRQRDGSPYMDTEPSEFECARCGMGRVRWLASGLADDCIRAEPPAPHAWAWKHAPTEAEAARGRASGVNLDYDPDEDPSATAGEAQAWKHGREVGRAE